MSPGHAAGPVYRLGHRPVLGPPRPVADPAAELGRALAALDAVAVDLDERAAAAETRTAGTIRPVDAVATQLLRAQAAMARDPVLRSAVADAVAAGHDAPHAIDAALQPFRATFSAAGGRLAARCADLDEVRDRAVAACTRRPFPATPAPGHPFVLIARDLTPADIVAMAGQRVIAVVAESGGPLSHTAILARSLGIPVVLECPDAALIGDGMVVAVDGGTGEVTVNAATVGPAADPVRPRTTGPVRRGRTADDHAVPLLANIGSARDLAGWNGEGVGLFRTELLFLRRSDPPGIDEQIAAYSEVFAALPGRQVVVRTLDAAADKPLPFLPSLDDPNPALGMRGVRSARTRPDILTTQLSAVAAAADRHAAEVSVMAPMVATADEARAFVRACRDAGLSAAGVMVEIPAAALCAPALLHEADFLSVGTNDLSQYLFAADRHSAELTDLLDPWQPALLTLVSQCAAAGQAAGRPVGVCGEAASDPSLAAVLVGMGVTSLSMSPTAIDAVRSALAARTRDECRCLAELALAAPDAAEARRRVHRHLADLDR